MIINSRKNERIKFFASLKQKKYRELHGLYLVEGVKMVREAFKYNQKVKTIIGLREFLAEYENSGAELIEVTREVLEVVCDTVTPQGIVAALEIPKFENKALSGVSVCLDGITDCGNLGTILRIMTAVGVSDIYLISCVDCYNPKTVRSSMSGIFAVKPHEVTVEEFAKLKGNVPLISADMDGENIFGFKPPKNFCVLFGSEAHGASDEMAKLSDKTIKIPMKNNLESLNVGVSAGIVLYELLKNSL